MNSLTFSTVSRKRLSGDTGTMDSGVYKTHYFYDEDIQEDFYRHIAPSEDIWKKFELVPGSPQRNAGCLGESGSDWRSEIMDLGWESPVKLSKASSVVLVRDCMWSSFSTREQLEKVLNERLSCAPLRAASTTTTQPVPEPEVLEPVVSPEELTAVVPAVISEKIAHSSGTESTSDSDEDEIDVVTVGKRKSYHGRQPVTITVRADPKLFHISIHQQQHNYAARLPPEPSPTCSQDCPSPSAEEPGEISCSVQPCSPSSSNSTTPSGGSDSEDLVKRKNHNYMERKRRNDLRSRFLALREEVPGLANASKSSKVVVLSKATEYLKSLIGAEQQLEAKKAKLRARHQKLLRRISQLTSR
ncbi:protein L-Myc [Dendrobates tinctorius]|uniref:protein L-Myc n=1 Tax=Dendrobates tinctorius TaxID=92724 RepID=UPI003CC95872